MRASSDSPASWPGLVQLADEQIVTGAWDGAGQWSTAGSVRLGDDTGQLTSVGTALNRQAESRDAGSTER